MSRSGRRLPRRFDGIDALSSLFLHDEIIQIQILPNALFLPLIGLLAKRGRCRTE
jgi:hypothetical protein